MNEAFYKHRPEKPFRKKRRSNRDVYKLRRLRGIQTVNAKSFNSSIGSGIFRPDGHLWLHQKQRQIVHVDIEKREGTPGIAFFHAGGGVMVPYYQDEYVTLYSRGLRRG